MFDWPQTFSQLEASFRAEDKSLGHKNVKFCKNGGVKRHDIWWIEEKSVPLHAVMCVYVRSARVIIVNRVDRKKEKREKREESGVD